MPKSLLSLLPRCEVSGSEWLEDAGAHHDINWKRTKENTDFVVQKIESIHTLFLTQSLHHRITPHQSLILKSFQKVKRVNRSRTRRFMQLDKISSRILKDNQLIWRMKACRCDSHHPGHRSFKMSIKGAHFSTHLPKRVATILLTENSFHANLMHKWNIFTKWHPIINTWSSICAWGTWWVQTDPRGWKSSCSDRKSIEVVLEGQL